jgi:hypothetical protein
VFGYELYRNQIGDADTALFPWTESAPVTPGSLKKMESTISQASMASRSISQPCGNLTNDPSSVADTGGEVVIPIRVIAEDVSYMAVIIDIEGHGRALLSGN